MPLSDLSNEYTLIMGDYEAAAILRRTVLSLYSNHYPIALGRICRLDARHYQVFVNLIAEFREYGETEHLRQLAEEILRRFPEAIDMQSL